MPPRGTIPRAASRNSRKSARERFLTQRGTVATGRRACAKRRAAGLPYAVDETKPSAKHAADPKQAPDEARPFRHRRNPAADPDRRAPPRNPSRQVGARRFRAWRDLPARQQDRQEDDLSFRGCAGHLRATCRALEGNPLHLPGEKRWSAASRPQEALGRGHRRPRALKAYEFTTLGIRSRAFGAGASMGLPIIGKLLGHSQACDNGRDTPIWTRTQCAERLRRSAQRSGRRWTAATAK